MNGRIYDPLIGRMLSADLVVPYPDLLQSFNRYGYVQNNPLSRIDPSGFADFVATSRFLFWTTTKVIGNDGVDDGKVFVVKTTESKFAPNTRSEVDGAGLSKSDLKTTTKFIKQNSGNTEAFQKNEIAYKNSIEIVSDASIRQKMVDTVSQDDGRGGTVEANNKEYGGGIDKDGKVVVAEPGATAHPKINTEATIRLPNTPSTYHGHPSGTYTEEIPVEGGRQTITNTYSFVQSPSPADIDLAGRGERKGGTHYVFGRSDGKVYIFNSSGVQAVIPMKVFLKPRGK